MFNLKISEVLQKMNFAWQFLYLMQQEVYISAVTIPLHVCQFYSNGPQNHKQTQWSSPDAGSWCNSDANRSSSRLRIVGRLRRSANRSSSRGRLERRCSHPVTNFRIK
ncbi:hypothetical protein L1987_54944 [Smallanthus sonchifolius]|uniref:Uncharacterized protein n=1 Tax=Smallanthus sonchifolius TaxID=185202 RepID=A0ACB9E8C2_9ASTR|nr:hypothetical protein L1987_54944 [Smallanthus sonchifolius]